MNFSSTNWCELSPDDLNISYTLDLARTNLEEARRSVLGLRANSLENITLADVIEFFAKNIQEKENLQMVFKCNTKTVKLPVLI